MDQQRQQWPKEKDVELIRKFERGTSIREMARTFGVSQSTIQRNLRRLGLR